MNLLSLSRDKLILNVIDFPHLENYSGCSSMNFDDNFCQGIIDFQENWIRLLLLHRVRHELQFILDTSSPWFSVGLFPLCLTLHTILLCVFLVA